MITITDCMAATSQEGQDAATKGTFGMFSKPITAAEFKAELRMYVLKVGTRETRRFHACSWLRNA